jgi:ABC-2 type transport system permease protein
MTFRAYARAFVSSATLQARQSFARPIFRFCLLAEPVLVGTVLFVLYKDASPEDFSAFAILGNALMSLWSVIVFSSCSDIQRERTMGTLEILSSAPMPFAFTMVGKMVGNTALGLLSFAVSLAVSVLAFGRPFVVRDFGAFALASGVSLGAFVAFSAFLAPVFWMSRNARGLMNAMEYPIYALCGVSFPVEALPGWLRPLSELLPPTHAARALRLAIRSGGGGLFDAATLTLVALSSAYALAAWLLFKIVDKRTRVRATLAAY